MGFPDPSWLTIRHHLFSAHIHTELRNAIRENATYDKANSSNKGYFEEYPEIHISLTFDESREMDLRIMEIAKLLSICKILARDNQR